MIKWKYLNWPAESLQGRAYTTGFEVRAQVRRLGRSVWNCICLKLRQICLVTPHKRKREDGYPSYRDVLLLRFGSSRGFTFPTGPQRAAFWPGRHHIGARHLISNAEWWQSPVPRPYASFPYIERFLFFFLSCHPYNAALFLPLLASYHVTIFL